jgi:hypothetical protein
MNISDSSLCRKSLVCSAAATAAAADEDQTMKANQTGGPSSTNIIYQQ